MSKLLLIATFISLLAADCEPKIENNKRVIVRGNIITENEQPVQNIEVTTSVEEYVLGKTLTDTDGVIDMVSAESYDDNYIININNGHQLGYTSVKIIRDENQNFESNIYNLGTVYLHPISNFTLTTTKKSSQDAILKISINFLNITCLYNYKYGLLEDPSRCYEEQRITAKTSELNSNLDLSLQVIKDTPLTITYQIDENPEVTVEVTPNQLNFDYEISY